MHTSDSKLFILGILLLIGALVCVFFYAQYAIPLFVIGLILAIAGAITGW